MLLEKEAYINKIEADVLDVNQIMQDLAELVNAQAQSVGKIIFHLVLKRNYELIKYRLPILFVFSLYIFFKLLINLCF